MWLVILLAVFVGAIGAFVLWWNKKLRESESKLNFTHGPGIRLIWPLRLLNLIDLIYQRVTGKYILQFSKFTYTPESHYHAEKEVLSKIAPLPCSDDVFATTQRRGTQLMCKLFDSIDFPWTGFGRIAQFVTFRRELFARTQAIKYAQEHPDILMRRIDDDNGLLVITGLPRTGSTFLQAILSLDPNGKSTRTWEMWRITPPAYPGDNSNHPNVKAMIKDIKSVDFACPNYMDNLRKVHYFDAVSPEEDVLFLYHVPWRWNFITFTWNSELIDFWLNDPASAAFACRYLHLCFQIMQSTSKKKHVITKNPGHSYYLETFMKEFPNAKVIFTHRDPASVVPSWSSLCVYSWHLFYQNEFEDIDRYQNLSLKGHVSSIVKQLAILADRLTSHREKIERERPDIAKNQFFDVNFTALISDPIALVKSIYTKFGFEFTAEFEENIKNYMNNQPRDKYGRVDSSLEKLGITKEEVNSHFGPYIEKYKQYFK